MKALLLALFLPFICATLCKSATIQSATTGDWNAGATWVGGNAPTALDDVEIRLGHTVTILATRTETGKTLRVSSGGTLSIAATGTLVLDNNTANTTLTNNGTVDNSGTITIGATTGVGNYGITSGGTFNNKSTGLIRIDRTTTASALFNTLGVFTNEGIIRIGSTVGASGTESFAYGLWNQATFNNKATGQIHIDRYKNGIYNQLSSALTVPDAFFTNEGSITIGANASTGERGLINADDFKNKPGAQLRIDNLIGGGISNYAQGVITNEATITIGANSSVGATAIDNQATFTNATGGIINADRATNSGISGFGGTFSNAGTVTIGAIAAIPTLCTGTPFSNNVGGILRGKGTIAATTFTNNGGTLAPTLMTFNAAEDFTTNILKIGVNGTGTAGTNFDQLKVTGAATLGGTLEVAINYTPANTDTITIVDATSLVGTFGTISPALPTNWVIKYNYPTTGKVSLKYENGAEIAITGNSNAIGKGSTTPTVANFTNFGSITQSNAIAKTYTIRNTGSIALTISSITSNNALFVVSGAPTTIATDASATFTVTFTPTAAGVQNAMITVNNNDLDEGVYDFAVTGEGLAIVSGAALSFTGSNKQVIVPDHASLDIATAITIEAWCNPSTASGYQVIALKALSSSWSGGYGLYTVGGVLNFMPIGYSSNHNTGYTLPLNQWTHIAATYDGINSKVYINGVLSATVAKTGAIPTNNYNFNIGCDAGVATYTFSGQLDEVRIWNRALTLTDIQANRSCEIPTTAYGLVANYHFNQGLAGVNNTSPAVNTLVDASGLANNGTLTNFALTGATANWVSPGGVTSGNSCLLVYTWTGNTSTVWTDATNWTPNSVPTSTDKTIVPQVANAPQLPATLKVEIMELMGNNKILLGNTNLTVGSITGANSTNFIVTNGTGSLTITNVGTTPKIFPVGPSATEYTPVTISNNVARDFTVKVATTLTSPVANFKYVNMQWNITPSVLTGNSSTLALGWSAANQAVGFNPAAATQINHYNTTTSTWDVSYNATVSGSDPYLATATGITAFSPFSISNSPSAVLAVELLYFRGQNIEVRNPATGGTEWGNLLTWKMANEENNKGFNVERLMDNGQWAILGFVKSTSSRLQTSPTLTTYDFTDKNPFTTSYYRLRQIDNDGKETLSKVVSVGNTGKTTLKVYPSVSTGILTIETSEMGDYKVFNLLGQQILSGKTTPQIDVSTLPKGTYFLKVGDEQAKFVKQ